MHFEEYKKLSLCGLTIEHLPRPTSKTHIHHRLSSCILQTAAVQSEEAQRTGSQRVEVEMEETTFFRNRYWILRHGKSIPNERGLIVSSLVRHFPHLFSIIKQFYSCCGLFGFLKALLLVINLWVWSQQENGVLSQYQLASEGVEQAQLAGELFVKVFIFHFSSSISVYLIWTNCYISISYLNQMQSAFSTSHL